MKPVLPVTVLRRVKRELQDGINLLTAHPKRDERAQGQLEALHHMQRFVRTEEHAAGEAMPTGRRVRRKAATRDVTAANVERNL